MTHLQTTSNNGHVMTLNPQGHSRFVVVCEHASCFIPKSYKDLGLTRDALKSHAAWDPGALAVSQGLSERLDAVVIASNVSRLVYDCNRPPSALDAMPEQSETITVPGNMNLTSAQKLERAVTYYEPFRASLAKTIAATAQPVIVTIHSFTPIYHGQKRSVEIGVLHGRDARLADVMLQIAPSHFDANIQRNAPYGPEHGVLHTLEEHAIQAGHLNVMLEIRNDLIQGADQQDAMADQIASWLTDALERLQSSEDTQ